MRVFETHYEHAYTEAEQEHIDKVNAFIPQAEKEALKKVKEHGRHFERVDGVDGAPFHHCFKSQFFHQAMNRLTREAGLRT